MVETFMRKIILIAGLFCLGLPSTAWADCGQSRGFSVSCERGVTVYRGHIPASNYEAYANLQARNAYHEQAAEARYALAAQRQQLSRQASEIAALNVRIDDLQSRNTRRGNPYGYGRRYIGSSPFLFGRSGFSGRGFRGRGFSSRGIQGRRNRGKSRHR